MTFAIVAALLWACDNGAEPRMRAEISVPATADVAPVGLHGEAVPLPCALGSDRCVGPELYVPEHEAVRGALLPTPTGTPQLLEFEAAYCAACAVMAPVVSSIVEACAKASAVVLRVDIGEDNGETLARHYRVDALPTFVAIDAEGHEVFRRVGVQKPAELASLVAEVSGEACVTAN